MTLDEKIQELHTSPQDGHGVAGVPRLGIPALNMTNGPAGAGIGGLGHMASATALPAPISLAATWDVNLAYDYGSIIGSEAKSAANGLVFGPDISIARVPQSGRTFEAFGEDPYLTSQMAVAESKAIQAQGVIAEPKHYAANNQGPIATPLTRSSISVPCVKSTFPLGRQWSSRPTWEPSAAEVLAASGYLVHSFGGHTGQ